MYVFSKSGGSIRSFSTWYHQYWCQFNSFCFYNNKIYIIYRPNTYQLPTKIIYFQIYSLTGIRELSRSVVDTEPSFWAWDMYYDPVNTTINEVKETARHEWTPTGEYIGKTTTVTPMTTVDYNSDNTHILINNLDIYKPIEYKSIKMYNSTFKFLKEMIYTDGAWVYTAVFKQQV